MNSLERVDKLFGRQKAATAVLGTLISKIRGCIIVGASAETIHEA
jgi:hypothetical protein